MLLHTLIYDYFSYPLIFILNYFVYIALLLLIQLCATVNVTYIIGTVFFLFVDAGMDYWNT